MKKLWRFEANEIKTGASTLFCCVCDKEISFGYELGEKKVIALILARNEGICCGECVAKSISDLKYTLERR